jgi:uncharacterized membrane protein YqjE
MATGPEPEEELPTRDEEPVAEGVAGSAQPSIGEILRGIAAQAVALVRQEIELARTELGEKVGLLRRYVASMAVGAALLACAFFFLLSALSRGLGVALALLLDERIAVWLAPLLLALLLGAIGLRLLAGARRTLKAEGLAPEETVESLRENTTWIKERLR